MALLLIRSFTRYKQLLQCIAIVGNYISTNIWIHGVGACVFWETKKDWRLWSQQSSYSTVLAKAKFVDSEFIGSCKLSEEPVTFHWRLGQERFNLNSKIELLR